MYRLLNRTIIWFVLLCPSVLVWLLPPRAEAQVTADGTLPTRVVSPDALNFTIDGGSRTGANLFHSFDAFSVPTNGSAIFNNAVDVNTIVGRVTGPTVSDIDGLVQVTGPASLFLLNPNGIVLGPNARLTIGGSFVASTGDAVVFADGAVFSADASSPPLLSVAVPTGIQWNQGAVPQPIRVQGSRLAVPAGLTLLGGDIQLGQAATLSADRVSLGGLATAGTVSLIPSAGESGFPAGVARGAVSLQGGSAVTAGAGGLAVTGRELSLVGGSRLETVTRTPAAAGDVTVDTTGAIAISGFRADGLFSGIWSRSETNTSGASGDVTINAGETLTLANRGFIATAARSDRDGGDIDITARNVVLDTGGQILTTTSDTAATAGNGGTITLMVAERLRITGESDDFLPNPLAGLTTFDLNGLPFRTDANPNVVRSGPGGLPYVSVDRTPTQIVSGATVLGAANQVDYYSFGVEAGGGSVILDIDFGDSVTNAVSDVNSKVYLYSQNTGELLAVNFNSDVRDDVGGSVPVFGTRTRDPLLSVPIREPGFYVVAVADARSIGTSNQLVTGNTLIPGQTYTLQASIENQGTNGLIRPVAPPDSLLNPNANYERSGILATSTGAGDVGTVTITAGEMVEVLDRAVVDVSPSVGSTGNGNTLTLNTQQLRLIDGGQLMAGAPGRGNAGEIQVNATTSVDIEGLGLNETLFSSGIFSSTAAGSTGNGNTVTLTTQRLRVKDGGLIATGTFGAGDAGAIAITATDSVDISGIGVWAGRDFTSGIFTRAERGSTGDANTLTLNTQRLRLSDGGQIAASTLGRGDAGAIAITATDSVDISGLARLDDRLEDLPSGIFTRAEFRSRGNGNTLTLNTQRLRLSEGGQIAAATLSLGEAGAINITATDSIDILGIGLTNREDRLGGILTDALPSGIFTSAERDPFPRGERWSLGTGNNLTLDTQRLRVLDGGVISAATATVNPGGDILITARDSIEVSGATGDRVSQITALSERGGEAGAVRLTADAVEVSDLGEIAVSAPTGDAVGLLDITANRLVLNQQGKLLSTVGEREGENGESPSIASVEADAIGRTTPPSLQSDNIRLSIRDVLLLRRGGTIRASATGGENGANITIDAGIVVGIADENSDIIATAQQGNGGIIQVMTDSILGLEFRPELTPLSDITANSLDGEDGVVQIETPNLDPSQGLTELPVNLADSSNQITAGCLSAADNTFVVTGRGGLPDAPTHLGGAEVWADWRPLEIGETAPTSTRSIGVASALVNAPDVNAPDVNAPAAPLVEATNMFRAPEGQVVLVAQSGTGIGVDGDPYGGQCGALRDQ